MLVLTQHTLTALCGAVMEHVASGNYSGPFYGAYVGLATAGPTPSKDVLRADYTEATYTGYARQALANPGTAFNGTDGFAKLVFSDLQFQPTDAVTPNTITHVLIFDAATNGNLLAVEKLDAAIPLPNAVSAMVYTPNIGFQIDVSYGVGAVES